MNAVVTISRESNHLPVALGAARSDTLACPAVVAQTAFNVGSALLDLHAACSSPTWND